MKQKTKKKSAVSGLGLMLMLFFSISAFNLHAQDKISGTVKDAGGITLPGVNIKQVGTTNSVATDINGKFAIILKPGQKKLEFSYLGFEAKILTVTTGANLNVILKESSENLDEVVVIGYQKISRQKITGSTTNVKAESIEQAAPVDLLQGVQGKVSGVQIVSNNGPGEGFDIRIRGIGSLNGGTGPLYVVDGQQTFDISNLNPSDIENFEVLKDGATTAAYGAQGANGVVIITTKSGTKGVLKIDVSANFGFNGLVGNVPVANTRQRILSERATDANLTQQTTRDSLNLGFRQSPDNQKLISRTGLRTQANISLSGGGDNSKYYWNTGYLKQEGVVINSDFSRLSSRLKLDLTPTKKVSLGTVVNLSVEETNGINSGGVLGGTLRRVSYLNVREPNGDLSPTPNNFGGSANPLQQLLLRENLRKTFKVNTFNYLEYKLLKQLTFKTTLGLNFAYDKREAFAPTDILIGGGFSPDSRANASEFHGLNYNVQNDNFLNYNQSFGKHNVSAFGGMQVQTFRTENLNVESDLFSNSIQTLNNANLDFFNVISTTGSVAQRTQSNSQGQFSLFTGLNYDFDGKYLIGGTIRRDGSSRFGAGNKFGYFPSGSLGWKISKENFMKDIKVVNNLMLRASFGVVGNDRIGTFEYLTTYGPNGNYDGVGSYVLNNLGNNNIKWESTESTNLGLDVGLFKNRLSFSIDAWRRDTKDLLINTKLPDESGFEDIRENIGSIRNQGFDFSINGTIFKSKSFSWKSSFNIGLLENTVTELTNPIQSGVVIIEEGQPIGNFTGFKQNGIFQYDESNAYNPTNGERLRPNFDANGFFLGTYNTAAGNLYQGDVRQLRHAQSGNILLGGDYIWEDVNNDGFIGIEDITKLGNGIATVYGGFSHDLKYKDFTLSTLFDYSFGNEIYRAYDHDRNSYRATTQTPDPNRIEQAWQKQGDIAIYPVIETAARRPQNRFDFASNTANSLYIEDGSFIRWRYVRLGYTVPKKYLSNLNIGLSNFSANIQVNNLLTWTNYSGYNPEFGTRDNVLQPSVDNLRYPSDREVLLSLKVQF